MHPGSIRDTQGGDAWEPACQGVLLRLIEQHERRQAGLCTVTRLHTAKMKSMCVHSPHARDRCTGRAPHCCPSGTAYMLPVRPHRVRPWAVRCISSGASRDRARAADWQMVLHAMLCRTHRAGMHAPSIVCTQAGSCQTHGGVVRAQALTMPLCGDKAGRFAVCVQPHVRAGQDTHVSSSPVLLDELLRMLLHVLHLLRLMPQQQPVDLLGCSQGMAELRIGADEMLGVRRCRRRQLTQVPGLQAACTSHTQGATQAKTGQHAAVGTSANGAVPRMPCCSTTHMPPCTCVSWPHGATHMRHCPPPHPYPACINLHDPRRAPLATRHARACAGGAWVPAELTAGERWWQGRQVGTAFSPAS